MDANGSRFQTLIGPADWLAAAARAALADAGASPPAAPSVAWQKSRGELTLAPLVHRFRRPATAAPLGLDARRGAAADRFGNLYWIDADRRSLRVRSIGSGTTSIFWPADLVPVPGPAPTPAAGGFGPVAAPTPPLPRRFDALTVTADHRLVVAAAEPAALLVFDLFTGHPPRALPWPGERPLDAFDMTATADGGVAVLDRSRGVVWVLDRDLRLPPAMAAAAADFVPAVPSAGPAPVPEVVGSRRFDLPAGEGDPIAVDTLPDGSLIVLFTSPASGGHVRRYRDGTAVGDALPLESLIEADSEPGDTALPPLHDLAVVQDDPATRRVSLFVVAADGGQAFRFDLDGSESDWSATLAAEFWPLRDFGGKALLPLPPGLRLGTAPDARLFYDSGDRWRPLLCQPRPRFEAAAALEGPVWDSGEPGCVWHRIRLDAHLPAGVVVSLATRAAESPTDLAFAPWNAEPPLAFRGEGSDLPWVGAVATGRDRDGTWETLLQKAVGRYAQVRIEIVADGRSTPALRALRVWQPRFSYLQRYLPAVYREDATSAAFLDRFLALFEGFFTHIEDRIAAVQLLFDPRTTPADSLDWLAGWFELALEREWSEAKRRLFLQNALRFCQYRGTRFGLLLALNLALEDEADPCWFDDPAVLAGRPHGPRIAERFATRRLPATVGWQPADGRRALDDRYRAALEAGLPAADFGRLASTDLPLMPPADAAVAAIWRTFCAATLGFVPSAAAAEQARWLDFLARSDASLGWTGLALPADEPDAADAKLAAAWSAYLEASAETAVERRRWQQFLAHRYRRIAALNAAHETLWTGFDRVALPPETPASAAALADWIGFEGTALTIAASAHRFAVLLPVTPGGSLADSTLQQRLKLAERVLAREKPAHTVADVRFFWDAFRVGEACLGVDTRLEESAAARWGWPAMRLDREAVGGAVLGGRPALPPGGRMVLE